jgi:alanine dehydrogenase
MIIGCVKEIKTQEYRVGLIPTHVNSFLASGHTVLIEKGAGLGSGFSDELYEFYGATIVPEASLVWQQADMIIKVKEPLSSEYQYFREGLIIFTYLHLAADEELTHALLKHKVVGLAYETLELKNELPLLKPMSEIAGRLSVQEAAKYLEKPFGGKGLLMSGIPGVKRAKVMIIGAGSSGSSAARIAIGMGADVVILDKNIEKLEKMEHIFGSALSTLYSTPATIRDLLPHVDVVIGAVLVPGAKAPKLINREDLKLMHEGTVLVDIAVDQGGCFETTKATTHLEPIYKIDGITHYCVANMPGAVPMTSTLALSNATLEYALLFAKYGVEKAIELKPFLKTALNTYHGKLTNAPVAEAFNLVYEAYDL